MTGTRTGIEALRTGSHSSERWLRETRELAEAAGLPIAFDGINDDVPSTATVVFAGAINAGKSRLINRLMAQDVVPVGSLASNAPAVRIVPARSRTVDRRDDLAQRLSEADADSEITVGVPSAWLESEKLELVDAPSLDCVAGESLAPYLRIVEGSDVTVVVVSASSPLSMIERALIEQSADVTSVVIVVSKLDQVEGDDATEVFERVREFAAERGGIPVLAAGAPDGGQAQVERLRATLEALTQPAERTRLREARLAMAVRSRLVDIIDAQPDDAELRSRAAAAAAESGALADARLKWEAVRLRTDERRAATEARARDGLDAFRHRLLHELGHDLSRARDPRGWWKEEVPDVLRTRLDEAARRFDRMLADALDADMRVLEQTLRGDADAARPRPGGVRHGDVRIEDLELRNLQPLRTAAVIGSGTGLAFSGLRLDPFGATASLLVGFVAETAIRKVETDQRDVIGERLSRTVNRLVADFEKRLLTALRRAYQDIHRLIDARADDELSSLEAAATAPAESGLRARAERLLREIDDTFASSH